MFETKATTVPITKEMVRRTKEVEELTKKVWKNISQTYSITYINFGTA
jgi:hypothetical protein